MSECGIDLGLTLRLGKLYFLLDNPRQQKRISSNASASAVNEIRNDSRLRARYVQLFGWIAHGKLLVRVLYAPGTRVHSLHDTVSSLPLSAGRCSRLSTLPM